MRHTKIQFSDIVDTIYSYNQFKEHEHQDNNNSKEMKRLYNIVSRIIDGELTEKQKKYFMLYAQGLTIAEIARMHNVMHCTMSRHISKARKRILKIVGYLYDKDF